MVGSPVSHRQRLEAESIQTFREATAEGERPVMLYSVGKDLPPGPHTVWAAISHDGGTGPWSST